VHCMPPWVLIVVEGNRTQATGSVPDCHMELLVVEVQHLGNMVVEVQRLESRAVEGGIASAGWRGLDPPLSDTWNDQP
jgi:hypothetical protein